MGWALPANLSHTDQSNHQKQQAFTSVTVVSVPLKTHHTHYCHATLTAHKTHCYNWLHCTLCPLWTGQPANANNSAVTGKEPNPSYRRPPCVGDNEAWQIISKRGEEVKTKGLFKLDKNKIRYETEKRWGETKHGSLSAMGGYSWWQRDWGPMAHLQVATHTQSPHTNRQKGAVVRQICCFTVTAGTATTLSLPQPAKKKNPRAWRRVQRVFAWGYLTISVFKCTAKSSYS